MTNGRLCAVFTLVILLCACSTSTGGTGVPLPMAAASHGFLNSTARPVGDDQTGDLLYASDEAAGRVLVLSYPQGKLIMSLLGMEHPGGECVDASGNVYVTNFNYDYSGTIDIFARGSASPFAVLKYPNAYPPNACSVDPKTGDVAATNSTVGLEIYDPRRGTWSTSIDIYMALSAVAYDDRGNLFIGGRGANGRFSLAEIPRSGKCLCSIALDAKIDVHHNPSYSLQWDGQYLALTNLQHSGSISVYRISISGKDATVVDTIALRGKRHTKFSSGYSWIRGGEIVAPSDSGASLAIWNYPDGGKPKKNIQYPDRQFVGVTVSSVPSP